MLPVRLTPQPSRPSWRSLDVRYDQCVGNCECLPGRDIPADFFSVHFSCIQGLKKPGGYETEREFMRDLYFRSASCFRYYYAHQWYPKFVRAHGRLPEHWTGPEVPSYNATHDDIARACALKLKNAEAGDEGVWELCTTR